LPTIAQGKHVRTKRVSKETKQVSSSYRLFGQGTLYLLYESIPLVKRIDLCYGSGRFRGVP
jgi:hypothetical protein